MRLTPFKRAAVAAMIAATLVVPTLVSLTAMWAS
jgi:hypothetical protein